MLVVLLGLLMGGGIASINEQAAAGGGLVLLISLGIAAALTLAIVIINAVMLVKHSQSLGKYWMKIQIVSVEDDQPADAAKTILLRYFANGVISTAFFWTSYPLIDQLFIFRQDQRCIHDLLAGTRVVDISRR